MKGVVWRTGRPIKLSCPMFGTIEKPCVDTWLRPHWVTSECHSIQCSLIKCFEFLYPLFIYLHLVHSLFQFNFHSVPLCFTVNSPFLCCFCVNLLPVLFWQWCMQQFVITFTSLASDLIFFLCALNLCTLRYVIFFYLVLRSDLQNFKTHSVSWPIRAAPQPTWIA